MQAVSIAGTELSDFRFDRDDDLSDLGGVASRFKFNVAAIALLKRLEAESRSPSDLTRDERWILARYTGWGDAELQELLTPDEIKSLLASTLNAHFTSLPIIREIYAALDHFGLAPHGGERILELDSGQSVTLGLSGRTKVRIREPAAGVGHSLARCRSRLEPIPNASPSRLIR